MKSIEEQNSRFIFKIPIYSPSVRSWLMEDVSTRVGQMSRSPGIQLFPSFEIIERHLTRTSLLSTALSRQRRSEGKTVFYHVSGYRRSRRKDTRTCTNTHQRDTNDA